MLRTWALLLFQSGLWFGMPSLPTPRQEVGVAAVEGRVYVIGGFGEDGRGSSIVEIFDTRSNEWSAGPPLPIRIHHPNVAAVGSNVYVAGGYGEPLGFAVADTYELDTDTLTWTRKADMPTSRGAGAAAGYNGRLYVFGGDRDPTVAEAAVFDPAANLWTPLPPLPTPRNHMAAAVLRGRIHVVGGRPGNLAVHEAFDPLSNTWTTLAPMPTGRSGIAAAGVGNFLFAFGGEGNPASPVGMFANHEAYDVDLDAWTVLDAMPLPRHGIGAAVVGNRIFIPGGATVAGFGMTAQSDFFNVNEDLLLPQFVVGGGYGTALVITNPSASRTAEVSISIADLAGRPLEASLDGAVRSTMTLSVPPLTSANINAAAPPNSTDLQVGSMRIRSNARLAAYAAVRHVTFPGATVYPAVPSRNVVFDVKRSQQNGVNTGVAILNTSSLTVSLVMTFLGPDGREVTRIDRPLGPGEQFSRFVHEIFPELQSADFMGTMTVGSNGQLAVAVLLLDRSSVVTIPVAPVE